MTKDLFDKFPNIETQRVILRQMTESDIDVVFKFNSCKDSLKYVVREPFKMKEEANERLSFFLSGINDKTAFWWVFTLKETGEDIGYGGLFDISETHNRAEIGYGLIKQYWNNGFMSEILKTILKFALQTAEFHKIYGIVLPGNVASIKLLANNRFVKEAHLKDHSFARGKYFDETIYSFIQKQT